MCRKDWKGWKLIGLIASLIITGAVAIDGDTLRLDSPGKNLRLRLWGIDAPEIKEPGGIEASRALAELAGGQKLICDLMDVDRYGGPVVRCGTAAVRDLACELVRQGHAEDWPRYSKGRYSGC